MRLAKVVFINTVEGGAADKEEKEGGGVKWEQWGRE